MLYELFTLVQMVSLKNVFGSTL